MELLKLNISNESVNLPDFINAGMNENSELRLSLENGFPFETSSTALIYSNHLIEELTQAEGAAFLRECRRVLSPGGRLRIVTFDLDFIIKGYQSKKWFDDSKLFDKGDTWIDNECEQLNLIMREWNHQWLYNEKELNRLAEMVGLKFVGRFKTGESDQNEFKGLENKSPASFAIEFEKPVRKKLKMPLVSVLIPAYKTEYFRESLESALNQSYKNLEIIISDDNESGDIKKIVDEYLKKDDRIKYYKNEKNLGEGGKGNYLKIFTYASGYYIKYLNDDDFLHKDCIKRMVDAFSKFPEATLVTSYRQLINNKGEELPDDDYNRKIVQKDSMIDGYSAIDKLLGDRINYIGEPTTVMFRKEDLENTKPTLQSFGGRPAIRNGDVTMWVNLLNKGDLIYLTDTLSYYRLHETQRQKEQEYIDKAIEAWKQIIFDAKRLGLLMKEGIPELKIQTLELKKNPNRLLSESELSEKYKHLNQDKLRIIDEAVAKYNIKSFADLGGVWGVDAGYTFYALDKFQIEKACLVDTNFTEAVLEKKKNYPQLKLINGNFGDQNSVKKVDKVDAVFLFDVLLHQVNPDWDEVLKRYSKISDTFIIYNQQFINSDKTVRLLELGKEGYFKNVPHNENEGFYPQLFEKLDEVHPQHKRKFRDIHNIWQWGIIDTDLYNTISDLGYDMNYYKDCGPFCNLENFVDHAFIFSKSKSKMKNKVPFESRKKQVEVFDSAIIGDSQPAINNQQTEQFENYQKWMKKDWNERAKEDGKYYVHSTRKNQSEAEFDSSGQTNVEEYVARDLQTICGNKNPNEMKVLEIGCGLGRMTKHLADIFGEVHAIDVSGDMVSGAKERLKNYENVVISENNGVDLSDFKNDYFDFVFSFIVFQHIPSKKVVMNYIREASRVLKTDGVFKFQVQGSMDPNWMAVKKDTWHGETVTPEDINQLCNELGFNLLASSGEGTQYSWYTLKKTAEVAGKIKIDENSLDLHSVNSFKMYCTHTENQLEEIKTRDEHEKQLIKNDKFFTVNGYCYICKKEVQFFVDDFAGTKNNGVFIPNWRERLVCPGCGLNNRMRAAIHLFEHVMQPEKNASLYLTEQVTPLFKWFSMNYKNVTGSEYLDNKIPLGTLTSNGIRNEDLTQLTFNDNQFDFILSFDVFEHIPDYLKAFQECLRVLKPGGGVYFTIPFNKNSEKNIIRAVHKEDGTIEHLLPAEIHGSPINPDEGCLAYYHFGWELLDQLKKIGYSEASAQLYWSKQFGYIGGEQILLVAKKKAANKKSVIPKNQNIENRPTKRKNSISTPLVSVVVPVFNNLEYTKNCLKSILENTQYENYEIIFINNASTDGTSDFLNTINLKNIKIISNDKNEGFVNACNQGANAANGDYVLMLNNDTEVQKGWLSALVKFAEETEDCGAVGSKLVYADGTLQEAGGIIFSDGNGWNYGRGGNPLDPRFNFVREVDYCSGAALMIRKSIWDKIDGFDQRYAPAYYEDTDMCFSIREQDYKVYYHPHSVVVHHEGKTAGTDLNSGYKKYQQINHLKFVEKWKKVLQRQQQNDPRNVVRGSDRRSEKNILVMDPFLPFFDRASGSLRLFQILKMLKKLNFHVTFIARNGSMEETYKPVLENIGVETISWDTDAMRAAGVELKNLPSTVNYEMLFTNRFYEYAVIDFWEMAEYYLPIIKKHSPKTKVIIDSVDIHFVRELREAELKQNKEAKKEALRKKTKELKMYNKADEVWVVTENDKLAIQESVKNIPINVVQNIHQEVTESKTFDTSSDLLFVGNFNHPPNIDAVKYLCEEIMPSVFQKLPDVKLYVVGNNPTEDVKALASENIIVTGFVEDLKPYLKNARVSVNPLRYGAGMKGKIGEALSWGLPVVTTSIGAEGMKLQDGTHALIADDAKTFASKIVKLYNNKQQWQKLSQAGKQLVEQNWSPSAILKKLQQLFGFDKIQAETQLPQVSVILLTYNALDYTKKCVKSIQDFTSVPYEIVFVENGSTDGTKKYLKELVKNNPNYKLVNNSKNMGFAAGNNQGVKKASADYVLLLNNDVEVSEGWLESMLRSINLDEKIGMVGPITNSISGLQQIKEVPYQDIDGFHKYAKKVREINEGVITPRRRIAGFAVLMPKRVYNEVGGFDTAFGTGNYEDDDLCLRVREKGYAIMVDESTFIHHYGSQTFNENKIDYKESLKQRQKIFNKKWPGVDYQELLEIKNPLSGLHDNKINEAYQSFTEGDAAKALDMFKSILKENPISGEGLLGAAYCLRQMQNNNEAILYLKKLGELQPDNAIVFNQLGLISMETGDLENAEIMFTKSIEIDNTFIDAQRNYANVLIQKGDFESGIVAFNTILENHPEDVESMLYLAQLNYEAERYEDCQKLVEKILETDPQNVTAKEWQNQIKNDIEHVDNFEEEIALGQKYLEDGDFQKAEAVFTKVLNASAKNSTALYGLGLVQQLQGKNESAKDTFEQVKKLEPQFEDVYNNLGILLMQEGKAEDAIDYFSNALQLNPNNINAQINISDALVEMQKYEEGIQTLMYTLKSNPNEINALLRMGNLFREAGRQEEAEDYFNRVLEIEPGNEIAREALA